MPRTEPSAIPAPLIRKRVFFLIKVFVLLHIIAITSWSLPNSPASANFPKDRQIVAHGDPSVTSTLPANASPLAKIRANLVPRLQAAGRIVSDGTLYENDAYVKPSPLKFYLMFTGFWQYWDMFSPNPASVDFYGTATIIYKDGSTKLFKFPRMYTMGIPKKYVSERYRKYYERAHSEDFKWVWPIFAQRVALINYSDPNNPPMTVILTRHWYPIAPPAEVGHDRLLKKWQSEHSGQAISAGADQALWDQARKDAAAGPAKDSDYHIYDYYTYKVNQQKLVSDKAAGVLG